MTLIDFLLICIIAFAVILAIRKVMRDRKSGKSCCGDCNSCGYYTDCGRIENSDEERGGDQS